MRLFAIYISFLVVFGACSPKLTTQKIEGVYVQDDFEKIKLHLTNDLFFFEDGNEYNHLPPYNCGDTLAFGYWEKDENNPFIKLYTNPLQYVSLIKMEVTESNEFNPDSIYFLIDNPIENMQFKYNANHERLRKIYYTLYIESNKAEFDSKVNFREYYSDKISLSAPKDIKIKSFEIIINPAECALGWRDNMPPIHVTTMQHEVMDTSANTFKINIPELTYCYLSSLRLNGDFVKILNKNQLEWDGHVYTRQ